MGLWDFLNNKRITWTYAKMLSGRIPVFTSFGRNVYASDVVQQAIGCIVSEMKKLQPQHVRVRGNMVTPVSSDIQAVLDRPNPIMTTADFIEKIVWALYLKYNAYIYPQWEGEKLRALYPLNPSEVAFSENASGTLFITLKFENGYESTLPYSRILHIRNRYSVHELLGGNEDGQPDNEALLKTLEINDTLLQGVAKALKSSFEINGVVKYNTMLDGDKMEKSIKELEARLKNSESGFMGMDLKGEFIPLKRDIQLVDEKTLQFIDSKILRNYGVSLPILTGDFTPEQMAAFYQKTIEVWVILFGQVFTAGLFSDEKRAHGNKIVWYAEELIFMNMSQKLEAIRLLGDSGALYENEKRHILGMKPLAELEGVRKQSLNYVDVGIANEYQMQKQTDGAQKEPDDQPDEPKEGENDE